MFSGGDPKVTEMGTSYLRICCCVSFGATGFTMYERLLQSTGKTLYSTIAQISGALTNIVLDYVFIYPFKMGVAGAAWATVIGQIISLLVAMAFHYLRNKEINGSIRFIRPYGGLIIGIYRIGISAAAMQTFLSIMMAGVNAILSASNTDPVILVGSFGIYYKIQQIALFSAFGLSNTIISVLSFNYGMGDKKRVNECIKCGILDTLLVTFLISVVFEIFANPLASLFGLQGGATTEITEVCSHALRIASIGFVFMGFSVAVQGILQSFRFALRPLFLAALRLVIFTFPLVYLFTQSPDVTAVVWWAFPIAEALTAVISMFMLKAACRITDNL